MTVSCFAMESLELESHIFGLLFPQSVKLGFILTYSHSSLVIDELERLSATAYVAYIYCDYRERLKQNIVAIVGNLIGQLLPACEKSGQDFLLGWQKKHTSKGIKLENLKPADVLEVLRELLSSHIKKRVFFCVDAVDECDGTTLYGLLELMKALALVRNVSCFVTGRSNVKDIPGVQDNWYRCGFNSTGGREGGY